MFIEYYKKYFYLSQRAYYYKIDIISSNNIYFFSIYKILLDIIHKLGYF